MDTDTTPTTPAPTFTSTVEALKQYDHELWLGRVCWYSVFELKVPHSDFVKLLLTNDLGGFLPPPPRGSDVFKRACKESERRKVRTGTPDVFENYQIKEVNKDRDNIWRQVVRETVDASNRRLDWKVLAELHYDRPNNAIHSTFTADGQASDTARDIVRNVQALYSQWSDSISSQHVRRLIRDVLRHTLATAIRPTGGIYFVREGNADKLDGLAKVLDALPGHTGIHMMPLLDDGKQRDMLKQAFEDESVGEIDRLLGEAKEMLDGTATLTPDRYAKLNGEINYLKGKMKDYSDLLSTKMTETETRFKVVDKVMFDLVGRIRHPRDTGK